MTTRITSHLGASRTLAAATLLALAGAACTGGGAAPSATLEPSVDPTRVVPSMPPPDPSMPSPESESGGPPAVGAVPPEIVQAAVDDAASSAGVDPSAVTVVSAEAMTFPSGALGCPKPGQMYTDALTPGYTVVVEAGGTRYDYRASVKGGNVRLCENRPGPG